MTGWVQALAKELKKGPEKLGLATTAPWPRKTRMSRSPRSALKVLGAVRSAEARRVPEES